MERVARCIDGLVRGLTWDEDVEEDVPVDVRRQEPWRDPSDLDPDGIDS